MWLINARSLQLEEYIPEQCPPYAILSHRWGKEEVTFKDMATSRRIRARKVGYSKIESVCSYSLKNGLAYVWVDTCCINKESSAELTEAINSMFNWYAKAQICYAYLSDVLNGGSIENSAWFTRGWTLQELLAPKHMLFFDATWSFLGTKVSLISIIERITSIDARALQGQDLSGFHVAKKMSWASKRQTTRVEDVAYCLMGLFDVNMPLLYGEGVKAFRRLQEEIIKNSDDISIFGWRQAEPGFSGIFATSPTDFTQKLVHYPTQRETAPSFGMTSRGMSLTIPLNIVTPSIYIASTGFHDTKYGSDLLMLYRTPTGEWERVHGYQSISGPSMPLGHWRDWKHTLRASVMKERHVIVKVQARHPRILQYVLEQRFKLHFITPRSMGNFFSQVITPESCRESWHSPCESETNQYCTHSLDVPPHGDVIRTELEPGRYGMILTFTSHHKSLKQLGFGFDFDGDLFLIATSDYRSSNPAYQEVSKQYDSDLRQSGTSLQEILVQKLIEPDYWASAMNHLADLPEWIRSSASTRWRDPTGVQGQAAFYPSSDGIWAIKSKNWRAASLIIPGQGGDSPLPLLRVEREQITDEFVGTQHDIRVRFWDPKTSRFDN